jgi:hypothetical protein
MGCAGTAATNALKIVRSTCSGARNGAALFGAPGMGIDLEVKVLS